MATTEGLIVVDTNVIAYLYIPGPYSSHARELLISNPSWASPALWRSEMRNVLALYLRKSLLNLEQATSIMSAAEEQMAPHEYTVASPGVLNLAASSNTSAYDCEFLILAQHLDTKLVTSDKKVLREHPDLTIDLKSVQAS